MSGLLFSSSFVPFSRFYFSSDLFEDSQPFRGLKASFGSSAHFCLFMKKVQDKLVFLVCLNRHQFTRLGAGVFWSGVSPRETHLNPRRAKNEIRNKQTNKGAYHSGSWLGHHTGTITSGPVSCTGRVSVDRPELPPSTSTPNTRVLRCLAQGQLGERFLSSHLPAC